MAQYTQLRTSEINELAKSYGFPNLEYAAFLEGGSENTYYLLRTDTEAYVLTICENKTAQETGILVNTLSSLIGKQKAILLYPILPIKKAFMNSHIID